MDYTIVASAIAMPLPGYTRHYWYLSITIINFRAETSGTRVKCAHFPYIIETCGE